MDNLLLEEILPELRQTITGRRIGKIFQVAKFEIIIDFRLRDHFVFVSVEPHEPRIYLIERKLRDVEKASQSPSTFVQLARKRLGGATLTSIVQVSNDRILELNFESFDEDDPGFRSTLIAQLTGRSANLFLTDREKVILAALRKTAGIGQSAGETYAAPEKPTAIKTATPRRPAIEIGTATTLSEALDRHFLKQAKAKEFDNQARNAVNKLAQELKKLSKLREGLLADLAMHGDADRWKHLGEVLLASVSTAVRSDESWIVTDYFDDSAPQIEIPLNGGDTPAQSAENYFRQYTRARNASVTVNDRLRAIESEIDRLEARRLELGEAIAAKDQLAIEKFFQPADKFKDTQVKKRGKPASSSIRSFVSSDGFEILVGKKAKDNDTLTFKMAKSLDLWMHAADYPGSHVVVRNPNRKEVPHRTLLEAAELAAFYSKGSTQPKAAVHYTQKKFVNKPKGAAPGLVSLSSFKTILVQPKVPEALER